MNFNLNDFKDNIIRMIDSSPLMSGVKVLSRFPNSKKPPELTTPTIIIDIAGIGTGTNKPGRNFSCKTADVTVSFDIYTPMHKPSQQATMILGNIGNILLGSNGYIWRDLTSETLVLDSKFQAYLIKSQAIFSIGLPTPKLKFKDYLFDYNPKTFSIETKKSIKSFFAPNLGTFYQDLGEVSRCIKGDGEFFGDNALVKYNNLYDIFKSGSAGKLILPTNEEITAIFSCLKIIGQPGELSVRYVFEFIEDALSAAT